MSRLLGSGWGDKERPSSKLSLTALAACFAVAMAVGALELRANLDQLTTAYRAGRARGRFGFGLIGGHEGRSAMTRVLQGLLALTKQHSSETLEKACETALANECWHLKTLRRLLGRKADQQQPLPFLDEHPLIRPLDDYAAVVARAIHRLADRPSLGEGLGRHDSGVRAVPQDNGPAGLNPQGCDAPSSALIRLSLAGMLLSRARLRFTRPFHCSFPTLVSPGAFA